MQRKSLIIFLLLINVSLAQEKNPTVWPYGGIPDSSRFEYWMERIPLNFDIANFDSVQFNNLADFRNARFSPAYFEGAKFNSLAKFEGAKFNSLAKFEGAKFDSLADFRWAQFNGEAYFGRAKFESLADFRWAQFNSQVYFSGAKFDSLAEIDFTSAVITDKIFISSQKNKFYKTQGFDFRLAGLLPGAEIVLYGPVKIKIQLEQMKFISLPEYRAYLSKKVIMGEIKEINFKGADFKKERFELDYIFAKSTMYQEETNVYWSFWQSIWRVWKWPGWLLTTLYYVTMGLGYRPFWLLWWALGIIFIFAFIYFRKMSSEINSYIRQKDSQIKSQILDVNVFDKILNSIYFSAMVFFTFRLNSVILNSFKAKDKKIIVSEWVIGFLVYIAFLTLSKAGSILHTLKSLFVG